MEQVLYALGKLEGLMTGANQRIDDLRTETHAMHRDLSHRIGGLERQQSATPKAKASRLSWLWGHLPIDRMLWLAVSALAGWGWFKLPNSSTLKYLLTGSW